VRYDILKRGLAEAEARGLTVTDDTSLAELVGSQVKIVQGSYSNLKITTPEDLFVAKQFEAIHHVPL
jgi:2-C-methyl-D-erythritol 4-phosphate cytidylyltransferase